MGHFIKVIMDSIKMKVIKSVIYGQLKNSTKNAL